MTLEMAKLYVVCDGMGWDGMGWSESSESSESKEASSFKFHSSVTRQS
jgi:hypothetical protein